MLSRRRSYGMGNAQPINLTDIAAAFDLLGVSDLEERRSLLGLIERIDDAWLVHQGKKRKDKADAAQSSPDRQSGRRGRRPAS